MHLFVVLSDLAQVNDRHRWPEFNSVKMEAIICDSSEGNVSFHYSLNKSHNVFRLVACLSPPKVSCIKKQTKSKLTCYCLYSKCPL